MRSKSEKTWHETMIVPRESAPLPWSNDWIVEVVRRLRDGWGTEDIAVQFHCNPKAVREHSRNLAANGVYDRWWPKRKAGGRNAH